MTSAERAQANDLSVLFRPRTVAVIGASNSPDKLGNAAVRSLRSFSGSVYAVNPRATDDVEGRPTVASVAELPEVVDLALFCVPPQFVAGAVTECADFGIRAGIVYAGGMAESGEEGVAHERELARAARAGSLRLLGPNTSGYVDPDAGICMSFASDVDQIPAGDVGIVAQSGGVNLTLGWMAAREGLGVTLAAGVGNAADVDSADIVTYLAADDRTKVILLHIEGTECGRRLMEAVAAATQCKPVVALKVGRSDVGDFAASHTGALIGSWQLARSALEQAGAVVVDDTVEMIDAAHMLSRQRLPANPSVGVGLVTGQAGPALLVADTLRSAGVEMPELAASTVAEIAKHLPPITFQSNPVDTARPSPAFGDVLAAVASDDAIDVVVAYAIHEPEAFDVVASIAGLDVPAALLTAGPPAEMAELAPVVASHNVAMFQAPERGARAVRALAADAAARARGPLLAVDARESRTLPSGPLDESQAKILIDGLGLRTPRRRVCDTREDAKAALTALDGPVVVKVLDAAIAHKTEAGGVHLGIDNEADLERALDAIDAIGSGNSRYLVEETAASGPELIVGGRRDPSFGPTVLLGVGGTGAEAINDVSLRLAPLSRGQAAGMLGELRGAALFAGFRGNPAVDPEELITMICAVGDLLAGTPDIYEVDLNPVRVTPSGLVALDALVVRMER